MNSGCHGKHQKSFALQTECSLRFKMCEIFMGEGTGVVQEARVRAASGLTLG